MTKFIINKRTDAYKTDVNLLNLHENVRFNTKQNDRSGQNKVKQQEQQALKVDVLTIRL